MMENVYLQEAFKALDILNEEDFNLTSMDGLKDAKEFIDNDEKSDFVDIIDPEAETEEEIKDSYVGDVILDCCVCHSKLYKHPDEVNINEEDNLANIDEECPFCYSTDGYEIVGMVAPYEENGETDGEEDIEEGILGTGIGAAGGAALGGAALGPLGAIGGAALGGLAGNILTKNESLKEELDKNTYSHFERDVYSALANVAFKYYLKGQHPDEVDFDRALNWFTDKFWDYEERDFDESLKEAKSKDRSKHRFYRILEKVADNLSLLIEKMEEREDLFDYIEEDEFGELQNASNILYQVGARYLDPLDDKNNDVDESLKESKSLKEAEWKYQLKSGTALRKAIDSGDYSAIKSSLINAYKEINKAMPDDFEDYELESKLDDINFLDTEFDPDIHDSEDDVTDSWDWELSDFYDLCDSLKIWIPLNESLRKKNKKIKEHFEKVEVETDTNKIEVSSEDGDKVTVVTEPKKEAEEIIAPVSDELQTEINPVNEPDEPNEDEFADIEVDEFSEDEFNELGESYLKKVYENVNSFKTSKVTTSDNKLVVEGIIGFNSGKEKKTSFVFESKDVNKKGKVRFIGENLQLSRGKKAFTVTGSINKGKFIAESLNYNYRTKDSEGKSTRLYGTVKIDK